MNKVLYHALLFDGTATPRPYFCSLFLKETYVEHSLSPYKAYEIVDIMSHEDIAPFLLGNVFDLNRPDIKISYKDDEPFIRQKAEKLLGKEFEFIDLKAKKISPEFLDFHEHSEFYSFFNPTLSAKRKQAVRSSIVGNCGISVYPIKKGREHLLEENVLSILGKWPEINGEKVYWSDLNGFENVLKSRGVENRLLFLTGHSALRIAAMEGNPNREATDKEIDTMCGLLSDMIDQGSIGFSSGLYYAPCIFSSHKELLALLKVVSKKNALFAVHIREEGNRLLESLNEVIELSKLAGCRLEISHLKAIGKKNQMKVQPALKIIEEARKSGLDVMFDQYPYDFGSTSLFSLLPPRILSLSESEMYEHLKKRSERERIKSEMLAPEGWESITELCTFDNVFIQALGNTSDYNNLSINALASKLNKDPFDAFFDCLIESHGLALMRDTTTTRESIGIIYSHPLSIFASDSLYAGTSWHPRSTECTKEALRVGYSLNTLYPMGYSINRMTLKGAERLGLKKYFVAKKGSIMNFVDLFTGELL